MDKKILITYIRDKNRQPNGVVVALDKNKIGWSLLNKKKFKYVNEETQKEIIIQDKWDKQKGVNTAIARAKAGVNWIDLLYKKYYIVKPECREDLNYNKLIKNRHPRIFKDLIPAIEKMRERAKRYFK